MAKLNRDQLLELDIDIYNKALNLVRVKEGYSESTKVCKYCGRFVDVLSCICDQGEEDFNKMVGEVANVSGSSLKWID